MQCEVHNNFQFVFCTIIGRSHTVFFSWMHGIFSFIFHLSMMVFSKGVSCIFLKSLMMSIKFTIARTKKNADTTSQQLRRMAIYYGIFIENNRTMRKGRERMLPILETLFLNIENCQYKIEREKNT